MEATTTGAPAPAEARGMVGHLTRIETLNAETHGHVSNIETLAEALDERIAIFRNANKACGQDTGQLDSLRRLLSIMTGEVAHAVCAVEETETAIRGGR